MKKAAYHSLDKDAARKLRGDMPPDEIFSRLAETFRVLSDPTRVKILYLPSQHELCVHDIAELLGASQPTVSHHLRILRFQGLVRSRREGKNIFYSLDDAHVVDLFRCGYDHVSHLSRD